MSIENECSRFDSLFVVSDLHVGGSEGFQIFRRPELLAGLIDSLSGTRSDDGDETHGHLPGPDEQVALLLNGDVVDFLAEKPAQPLAIESGTSKLRDIVERSGFNQVFAALRRYLRRPNRRLVIVLGNHDVELALPGTQSWLHEWLADGDDAARGRVVFATDGSGYRCRVAGSDVLCVHGEIADDWNRINHQALRKIAHGWKAGQRDFDWEPCGGTQLVLEVMNEIKRDFPFVDLLKPEREAVLPLLKSLDVATFRRVFGAGSAFASKLKGQVRSGSFLNDDGQVPETPDNVLSRAALELLHADHADESDDFLTADPVELARAEGGGGDEAMLGLGRVIASGPLSLYNRFVKGKSEIQTLRSSLRYLMKGDRTFHLDEPDEPFEWSEENVDPSIEFVIAGHTHLERAIPRAGGAYFNSGTWASLIKLTDDQLNDDGAFEQAYTTLKESKTVSALEDSGMAHTVPTVVAVTRPNETGGAVGELFHAEDTDGGVRLRRRDGSRIAAGR